MLIEHIHVISCKKNTATSLSMLIFYPTEQ